MSNVPQGLAASLNPVLSAAAVPPSPSQKTGFNNCIARISQAAMRISTPVLVAGCVVGYTALGTVVGASIGAINAACQNSDVSEGAGHGAKVGGIAAAGYMLISGVGGLAAIAALKLSSHSGRGSMPDPTN